jgi:hypothetical protein
VDRVSGEHDTLRSEAFGDQGDPGCPWLPAEDLKRYLGARTPPKNVPDQVVVEWAVRSVRFR